MDVNAINIMFCKDYKKELDVYLKNAYLNYAPINSNINNRLYKKTEFYRKDPITYIKHRRANLWAYQGKDGNLIWDNLQCEKNGFSNKVPQVFYIEYFDNKTFILYINKNFGSDRLLYLKYSENGPTNTIEWTTEIMYATFFHWDTIEWRELTWLGKNSNTYRQI